MAGSTFSILLLANASVHFDSFDEVASGNAQAYIAADYYWKGKHPGWAYFTAVPFGLTVTDHGRLDQIRWRPAACGTSLQVNSA